jgi:hypothetical protein
MNELLPPPRKTAKLKIDVDFLLREVSSLRHVKKQRITWNEYGEKIATDFPATAPGLRLIDDDFDYVVSAPAPHWKTAKQIIHEVFAANDPKYDDIRKRLWNSHNPSNQFLLSTLSIWLSGVIGFSVSITRPMVAAMLYGIATSDLKLSVLLED